MSSAVSPRFGSLPHSLTSPPSHVHLAATPETSKANSSNVSDGTNLPAALRLETNQSLSSFSLSCNGSTLAVGGKEVKLIQLTANVYPLRHSHTQSSDSSAINDVSFHPTQSEYLLAAPTNSVISLYNIEHVNALKKPYRSLADHERTVNRVLWHPHHREKSLLFSCSMDGTIKQWGFTFT